MKMTYTTTIYKGREKERSEKKLSFLADTGQENEVINLYPQMKYQSVEGFAGAITDSAGYVFSRMSNEQKEEMLNQYFGKDRMKYRMVRIPIDSCDFSLEHYEADSDKDDAGLEKFSLARVEKYIFPLLDAAERIYGEKLEIMLSPWSPPAYMKTNGERNNGGQLKREYWSRWAAYICKYIKEFKKRGYLVSKLTLQNEPKAVQTWDSCVYSAEEQREFLKDYMWPMLVSFHLEDIEIYIWDHNKERCFEWAETIIDNETEGMIAGLAFHWYSGDHFDALRMIREKFPAKKLLMSEACIEYSKFAEDDNLNHAQKYAHDIIGDFNAGMNTFIDWNLLLDELGGPNHVQNYCDAPYLYNIQKKELMEQNTLAYLWHFSHFIEPGARRIGTSSYTEKLEVTAFEKNGKIAFVILNRTNEELPAWIRLNKKIISISVLPDSISSGIIEMLDAVGNK